MYNCSVLIRPKFHLPAHSHHPKIPFKSTIDHITYLYLLPHHLPGGIAVGVGVGGLAPSPPIGGMGVLMMGIFPAPVAPAFRCLDHARARLPSPLVPAASCAALPSQSCTVMIGRLSLEEESAGAMMKSGTGDLSITESSTAESSMAESSRTKSSLSGRVESTSTGVES